MRWTESDGSRGCYLRICGRNNLPSSPLLKLEANTLTTRIATCQNGFWLQAVKNTPYIPIETGPGSKTALSFETLTGMVEAAKGSLLASSRGGTVDGKSRDAWHPCQGFLPELPQNRREEGELPSRGEDGRNAGLGKWPTIYGVVLVLGWHRMSISIRAGGVVDGNVDSHCLSCSDGLFPSGSNLWGVWTTGDRSVKRVVIRSSPFSAVCSRVCLCSPGDQNNVRSQSLRADNASRQDEIRFPLHAREGGRDRGIHHSLQRRDEEVSCEVVTASSALNMHLSTKSQLLEFPSQQSAPLATPLAAPHRLILFYFYFLLRKDVCSFALQKSCRN